MLDSTLCACGPSDNGGLATDPYHPRALHHGAWCVQHDRFVTDAAMSHQEQGCDIAFGICEQTGCDCDLFRDWESTSERNHERTYG